MTQTHILNCNLHLAKWDGYLSHKVMIAMSSLGWRWILELALPLGKELNLVRVTDVLSEGFLLESWIPNMFWFVLPCSRFVHCIVVSVVGLLLVFMAFRSVFVCLILGNACRPLYCFNLPKKRVENVYVSHNLQKKKSLYQIVLNHDQNEQELNWIIEKLWTGI